jgi:hypothetical protein
LIKNTQKQGGATVFKKFQFLLSVTLSSATLKSYYLVIIYLTVALPDLAGTLPKPYTAGWVDMEWVTEDFTKSEVWKSWRSVVLHIQKVPLQGFFSVPIRSVGTVFLHP